MEEEDYKKTSIWVWVAIVGLLVSFMAFAILTEPIEYNLDCSIDGVNVGINESLNFTGFNLNNSEIKCKIDGKVPAIALLGLR